MMKKVLFFIGISLLLTGCFGPSIVVGEFAPLGIDKYGKHFVHAPSRFYKEIVYDDFAFDWQEEDGFVIYPAANTPAQANWSTIHVEPEKMHTAFFAVVKIRHYMMKNDQEALLAYAKKCGEVPPYSKFRVLDVKYENCTFKGHPAVKVTSSNVEQGRELYTRDVSYYFFHHLDRNYIFFITWSERGTKDNYQDTRIASQGEIFFKNFRLRYPENSDQEK